MMESQRQICLVFFRIFGKIFSYSKGLVVPRDYTPFYYLLMSGSIGIAASYIFFVNPSLRRSQLERGEKAGGRGATDAVSHG